MTMKHDEFDPITMTKDGSVVWKRYDGGNPIVTGTGQAPEQAPGGDAEPDGRDEPATRTEGERVASK
jgi:hypothetical protein